MKQFFSHFKHVDAWVFGLTAAFWSAVIDVASLGFGSVGLNHYVDERIPVLHWKALIILALYNGLKSAFFYLKRSPFPDNDFNLPNGGKK